MTGCLGGLGWSHRQALIEQKNQLIIPESSHVIPESPHRHSRVGLSGIYLDLDLQQPEIPGQHGFPLRACGNDGVAGSAGMTDWQGLRE
ncbi:hypothetical protein [Halomonas sp. FME65]|uniref:hypothetical protein n=1 Tax=Halomonas sp. FME65 TaxID=2742614 RepID=UPI001865F72A|nr:hypothetical protein [Halomonas sp. FME65]